MNRAATPTTPDEKNAAWPWRPWLRALLLLLVLAALTATLGTCSPRRPVLEEVRALGVLKVAVVNSPTVYYTGPGGEATGFEFDLLKRFADQLGVRIEPIVVANPPAALDLLRSHGAHMAAASLASTPERKARFRFSRPLLPVVPTLVYRLGQPRPKRLDDLHGTLRVPSNSAAAEALRETQKRNPYMRVAWQETEEDGAEELLYQVSEGTLDYTVVNSDLLAVNQRYYPNLRAAFTIADALPIAWAYPKDSDNSLSDAIEKRFEALGSAELARIKDRHFGHVEQVDSYGALTLATHVDTRLPRYRESFRKAAEKHQLDWRLLAAIGYQESHWDADATSPTGVRGIMQITNSTADHLKVENRDDPTQSIYGGARYFKLLANLLPPEIAEPDRTWMTLAAYNMGIGHLLDARELTKQLGGDPNRWLDVRNRLPLLTQPRWYSKTRHGYARGHQAVIYVGNIRAYYDMLVWLTGDKNEPKTELEAAKEQREQQEKRVNDNPLNINSPVF